MFPLTSNKIEWNAKENLKKGFSFPFPTNLVNEMVAWVVRSYRSNLSLELKKSLSDEINNREYF